jgi:hypothetical protein
MRFGVYAPEGVAGIGEGDFRDLKQRLDELLEGLRLVFGDRFDGWAVFDGRSGHGHSSSNFFEEETF